MFQHRPCPLRWRHPPSSFFDRVFLFSWELWYCCTLGLLLLFVGPLHFCGGLGPAWHWFHKIVIQLMYQVLRSKFQSKMQQISHAFLLLKPKSHANQEEARHGGAAPPFSTVLPAVKIYLSHSIGVGVTTALRRHYNRVALTLQLRCVGLTTASALLAN